MKTLFTILFFSLFYIQNSYAIDFYWKGNSGNYNDTTKWEINAIGSGLTPLNAPLSTDNVFFPASAFPVIGDTIWVDGPASCLNMTWDAAISVANAPVFIDIATNPVGNTTLDIYGSLELSPNMTFNFRGILRFRSISGGVETINTHGHPFLLRRIEFDGASTTEWQLVNDLYLDDVVQGTGNWGTYITRQGSMVLKRGIFNTNGKKLRVDFFYSVFTNNDRGINFQNSEIRLCGRTAGTAKAFEVNFDYVTGNYSQFSMLGSVLIFDQTANLTQVINLGNGLHYDSLSTDNQLVMQGGTRPDTFNYVNVPLSSTFNANLDVVDLHLGAGRKYSFSAAFGKGQLTVENVHMPIICDKYTEISGIGTTVGLIRKKTAGTTLTLQNIILENMDCDVSGGRGYVLNNSIDIGGNHIGWVINLPLGTDMYFRDFSGDQNWHDPNNWEIWNGAAFVANGTGCIPSPADHVYFDGASFPNPDKWVSIDSAAFCHDMRWLSSIPLGCQLILNAPINIFGTMELHGNMQNMIGTTVMRFYGAAPDSIITNGVTITYPYLWRYANYHLIGNTVCNDDFTGFINSTVHANNLELTCQEIHLYNRYMDSVQVHIKSVGFYDGGGIADYTGNTTFHFEGTGTISRANRYYPYYTGVRLPNTIAYNNKMLLEGSTSCTIEGDLYLHKGAEFRTNGTGTRVTGTMALYTGNATFTAGNSYEIKDLYVADTLFAASNCNEQITIKPYLLATGNIEVADTTILDYCFVLNMNNSGTTITSNTSIDGGGNTNFVFNLGSGTTYYWRADLTNASNWVGAWENPNHWTTNAADLVGQGICIPSLADTVIFDGLSFSGGSNGCTISTTAFCKTLICQSDIAISGNGKMYVGESFHLANAMSSYNYVGKINFIGSGTNNILDANNTNMPNVALVFDNSNGIWNLANDLYLSATANNRLLGLFFNSGRFNTNNYTITSYGLSLSALGGTLDLGTSTINMLSNSNYSNYYGWLWVMGSSANVTLLASQSTINFFDNTHTLSYDKDIYLGNGQTYNRVNFYEKNETTILHNNANFGFAYFDGTANINGSNSFDSLRLNGGHYYYLANNSIQTLASEHGKIIADGSPSNFVYIECLTSGGTAYFHKEYGNSFCLDYVKVKDNEATKGLIDPVNPSRHPFLFFETGVNSDNINGSATGIWNFNLPPILTVSSTHVDSLDICSGGAAVAVPITLTGTYPYSIIYSWIDVWGGSGQDTIIVTDADSNVTTPFVYNLQLYPNTSTDYMIDVAALRCGERLYGAPIEPLYLGLSKEELVAVNRTGNCTLHNNTVWTHFMDDVDTKPMLSILDSTSVLDTDSLGTVVVQTNFDPSIQYWSGTPYLQRHWKVDPTNRTAAGKVRLYFTQEELDSLTQYTFVASLGRSLNPATELILWKFEDTITVGTPIQIPFTVIPLVGRAASPFTNTTDIIAIEFDVASFSGFLLQPTVDALLPLDLLAFDAKLKGQKEVQLDWNTANESNLDNYEIQRSKDAIQFESIGNVLAQNKLENVYQYLDENPYASISYYRLKVWDKNGKFTYSPIRVIERTGLSILNIYPIPAQEALNIDLSSTEAANISIEVLDVLGRSVLTQKENIRIGTNKLYLDVQALAKGTYIVKLSLSNQSILYKKVIIGN